MYNIKNDKILFVLSLFLTLSVSNTLAFYADTHAMLKEEIKHYTRTPKGPYATKIIALNKYSDNYYSKPYNADSRVFNNEKTRMLFYVPTKQHNIIKSDTPKYSKELWVSAENQTYYCHGSSQITALLTNTNNEEHEVVLRAQKSKSLDSHCLAKLNDGGGDMGAVIVTFKAEDNPRLANGTYNGDFIIIGASWEKYYRVAILVDVHLTSHYVEDPMPAYIRTTVDPTAMLLIHEKNATFVSYTTISSDSKKSSDNKKVNSNTLLIYVAIISTTIGALSIATYCVIKKKVYAPVQWSDPGVMLD